MAKGGAKTDRQPQRHRQRRRSEKSPADLLLEKTAREKMAELRQVLAVSDDYVDSFPRDLAENLEVSSDVVMKMMGLEEMQALRKRAKILSKLEACKTRIVTALEMADDTADDIPWGKDDGSEKEDTSGPVVFQDPNEEVQTEEVWKRKAEQSEIMCQISQYIQACKSKDADMVELIDWMSNFAFEITWDEVGVRPIDERESDEADVYRGMVLALQKAWQCARKIEQLIQLIVSDDTYDVLSSKFPPHIAAARKKRKTMPSRKLWCSNKLRNKIEQYCKLKRSPKKKNQSAAINQEITIWRQGEDVPENNPFKEVEALIFREVSNSWKEASLDIMYYVQEVIGHRFTKPSCKKRLERAMLLLEFINAAIEGKINEAGQTQMLLRESQATVNRMQEEATQMQKEITDLQKLVQQARRKIAKQKKQLEAAAKENEKLSAKIGALHDQIATLQKHVEELRDLPNQSEFDECKERLEELEEDYAELEQEVEEAKTSLNTKTVECDSLKKKLDEEKEVSAHLAEEVQAMEEESEKATKQIQEMEEKLSAQENNIMSLRLMVYYKDEVIRRLKQAAIELKTSEKQHRAPKRPPPSPIDQEPKISAESVVEEPNISRDELQEKPAVKAEDTAAPKAKAVEAPPPAEKIPSDVVAVSQKEEAVIKYDQKMHSDRLTQGRKSVHSPIPTRVIFKPDERQELIENCQRAHGEIDELRERLEKMADDYKLKMKTAVDQEKHKSVLDKMKNEEELQNLCFAVCDETMRVQKEMRKFNEHMSAELGMIIGLKGKLFEESSGDRKRKSTGLMTMQTSNFGGVGAKQQQLMQGGNMQDPMGGGATPGGQGGMADMMAMMDGGMQGGFGGGMGGFGGQNMPHMGGAEPASDENSEDLPQEMVKPADGNYWNSLRTAVVGKNAAKSSPAPKPEKRNSLAAKVLAEKQRRASMAMPREPESVPRFSSGYCADSESSSEPDVLSLVVPSSGIARDDSFSPVTIRLETPTTDSESQNPAPPVGIVVINAPETDAKQGGDENTDEDAPKMLSVVDRRMARLGQRRRSSMIPLQDVLQIARRSSIRAPPRPKVVKFRGFFPEFGDGKSALDKKRDALSREAAVRRRKAKLEEEEASRKKARKKALAAATGIDDDPLKQAEVFVRNISTKVMGFLSGMSTNLVDAIKTEKLQAGLKLQQVEQDLVKVKVQAKADVAAANIEKEKKAAEARKAKRALINFLAGGETLKHENLLTAESNRSDKSLIPANILAGLKQAENEIVAIQDRLLKAAKKHSRLAEDFQHRSFELSSKVKDNERAKAKAEAELRHKEAENKALRVQLHEFRKTETQKMFMSLREHQSNKCCLEGCTDLDVNIKKLGLALLEKSMTYPRVRLRNLVVRYKQHCVIQNCINSLRCKLKEEEGSRIKIYGHRESREVRSERKLLYDLLHRLECRHGMLGREWEQIRRNLEENRQKTLIKLTVLFHKVRQEQRDIHLIQPTILRITGRGGDRLHNNSPALDTFKPPCKDYRVVFPLSGFEICGQRAAPNTPASAASDTGDKWQPAESIVPPCDDFDIVGTKPPEDKTKSKQAVAQWCPQESLFCPFSNRSGRLVPANSRQSTMIQPEAYKNQKRFGVALPPLTPATKASLRRHKRSPQLIEFPRILELDVQARLRQAKLTCVNNMQLYANERAQMDATHAYSSQIYIRASDTSSSWNSSMSWYGPESLGELGEFDDDSEICFPPLVPDLKRPSSIPSPKKSSKRKVNKEPYNVQSSWLFADTKPTVKPSVTEKVSANETTASSSSSSSTSRSSTTLPPIQ